MNGTFSNPSIAVRIIGVLLPDPNRLGPWGMTECDIAKRCGCDPACLLESIDELMRLGVIRHRITQEGTAGPFAHRYWINDGLKIEIETNRGSGQPICIVTDASKTKAAAS